VRLLRRCVTPDIPTPEVPISAPHAPNPARRDRSRPNRLVNIALLCVTLINIALAAALVLIERREVQVVGTISSPVQFESAAATETDATAEETTPAVDTVDIPADYDCTQYDLALYEQYAGGEHNEEYFVADAYTMYLDVDSDMLYCTFMIGWPADTDEIELTIEVWDEVDEEAAFDAVIGQRGNWEVGVGGALEDYFGVEGEGFIFESEGPEVFTKIVLRNGTSVAAGEMQSDRSLDLAQTRSILLNMIAQAWLINAENPR
jgi:hypothetical protein